MTQLHRENHYVPRFYLRNWSEDGNTVWMYRRLVSHKNVERWKRQSIENTAYVQHLYSRQTTDKTLDDFERWLNYDIENPAHEVMGKVNSDISLTRDDWEILIRYTAVQMVRTPAYFARNRDYWIDILPSVMADAGKKAIESVTKYQQAVCTAAY